MNHRKAQLAGLVARLQFCVCAAVATCSPGSLHAEHAPAATTISAENGAFHSTGAKLEQGFDAARLQIGSGPRDGVAGITAPEPTTLRGELASPVDGRGSVMFWFHTDRDYRSGTAETYSEHPLVAIPGVLSTTLVLNSDSEILYVGWGHERHTRSQGAESVRRGLAFDRVIRIILPELPGPGWHHLAVRWDAKTGDANAFVDGTPFNLPGSRIPPWKPVTGKSAVVNFGPRFGLADIRIAPRPFDDERLPALIGPAHLGALDAQVGAKDLGTLSEPQAQGRLLYARSLGQAGDTKGWVLEGPGILTFQDGWMTMKSERPNGPDGHVVYWVDRRFPASYRAEFDFEVLSAHGLNILFFSAHGHDGMDLFDPRLAPRDGTFIQYTHGDIDSYHISYFANSPAEPRSTANLRKNSGFYLLANGPVGVDAGGDGVRHHAVLVKHGGHIQMAVDGRVIIDYTDDGHRAGPVWAGGHIGFRQMQWSVTRYRDLRVYALD